MNTIPSIFKRPRVPYTVVGGYKQDRIRKYSSLITVLLLNRRGKFYRDEFLEKFKDLPHVDLLCMEGPDPPYDIEERSRRFPAIRFLLVKGEVPEGERINLGMEESRSRYVFVAWSDMRLTESAVSTRLAARLDKTGNLCTVPILKTGRGELVPSIQVPALIGGILKVVPWSTVKDGTMSLFPFDFCGIYDRERFLRSGGFDPQISNSYWQKMDFGFRCFMWGEKIVCDTAIQVSYQDGVIAEDSTPDGGYKLFYLKNVAVVYKKGRGILPWYRLPGYALRSDTGPLYALKEFFSIRRWVKDNHQRFKADSRAVASIWEVVE
jgi:hypothetical protein